MLVRPKPYHIRYRVRSPLKEHRLRHMQWFSDIHTADRVRNGCFGLLDTELAFDMMYKLQRKNTYAGDLQHGLGLISSVSVLRSVRPFYDHQTDHLGFGNGNL